MQRPRWSEGGLTLEKPLALEVLVGGFPKNSQGAEEPTLRASLRLLRREGSGTSLSPTNSGLCWRRFVQLAPQYYFSNLPPSESKDILQQAMDRLAPAAAAKGEQPPCEKCPETTEQRCALQ